ncbi:MAG: glycosyltransferase [Jaaginema sp. PMC 1079.18]|nr:glycosyltransferase [Jaaginema sp. PMC 1080.18]MEC4849473.1 glycosyltransferase [Jaaginema sp. PMC 1079.18]MEC4866023.1 glycosyltransferase [Jaaginema sp. PMC 1078.18]
MKIAYLVNQYPKVSHSFIRREIRSLEALGIDVLRFSIRSCQEELVDPGDREELEKTRYILAAGILPLLGSLLQLALTRPVRWVAAFKLACQLGWKSDRGLILHWAYLAEACLLWRWLKNSDVQGIHVHFGTNSAMVALLCQVLGGPPYSFTVHGPEEFDKAPLIALTEKIKRAAFVVAISSFGRSQLYRWCDYSDWSKIKIVRCGVDQSFLAKEAPAIAFSQTPEIVCVGRLCEQKGQLLLIEAIAPLAAENRDFQLTLVGDGEMRSQIEDAIARSQLQNHVTITGWASNATVQKHILAARALVLPSFAEGLPVVIMESLALRRPVLTTYVAGIPELVEPGRCGWLIPAGSVTALTAALREVLDCSPEILNTLGTEGAARVAKAHNATTEAAQLAQYFQQFLVAPHYN